MESQFIPFVPKTAKVAGPATSASKKTRSEEPSAQFRLLNTHTHAQVAASNAIAQPVVTLQREGDRVTQIRIQCVCGQVIDLECVY